MFKKKIRRGKTLSKMVTSACLSMLQLKFTALTFVSHSFVLDPLDLSFPLFGIEGLSSLCSRQAFSGQNVLYRFLACSRIHENEKKKCILGAKQQLGGTVL